MGHEAPVNASLNKRVMYLGYVFCILFLDTPRKDLTAGNGDGTETFAGVGVGVGD